MKFIFILILEKYRNKLRLRKFYIFLADWRMFKPETLRHCVEYITNFRPMVFLYNLWKQKTPGFQSFPGVLCKGIIGVS